MTIKQRDVMLGTHDIGQSNTHRANMIIALYLSSSDYFSLEGQSLLFKIVLQTNVFVFHVQGTFHQERA